MVSTETFIDKRIVFQHVTCSCVDIYPISLNNIFAIEIKRIGESVTFLNIVTIHSGQDQFTFGQVKRIKMELFRAVPIFVAWIGLLSLPTYRTFG